MNATLISSDGCREKPAIVSQFFAPNTSRAANRFSASSASEMMAAGQRSALTWLRSRSHQPSRKNSTMPTRMRMISLVRSLGVLVAQTSSPSEQRKNAIVSTSKPERSIVRMST